MTVNIELIHLGSSDVLISPLGIGAWAWGDRIVWGYGKDYTDTDIKSAIEISLDAGINFFDTAEVYGMGKSERILSKYAVKYARANNKSLIIATKFFPFPWRLWSTQLVDALQTSLKRIGVSSVDLYQIHMPFPPMPIETWATGLALAVEKGLTRTVGVSNFNLEQMNRTQKVLSSSGVPLVSNQVIYNLLNREVEFNGLLDKCKDTGVTLIAYSPLAKGLLTGKYSPQNPPPGIRSRFIKSTNLDGVQSLIRLMTDIGRECGGTGETKKPSQIALNYLICKGCVPIPGAKNSRQAQENAGALGWRLSNDQVAALDKASLEFTR
jgi:aryl-alcohol dehydrogenase-like predicted oxidoreductase